MKFIILGGYEPYIIDAEDWEDAFWKARHILKDNLASITQIPQEAENG